MSLDVICPSSEKKNLKAKVTMTPKKNPPRLKAVDNIPNNKGKAWQVDTEEIEDVLVDNLMPVDDEM